MPLPPDAPPAGAPSVYIASRSRFTVLLLFALGSACNAFAWICFSPIFSQTQSAFLTSAAGVNALSACFLFVYAPASVLTAYVVERWGLRAAIVLGALLNAVCGWLRFAACYLPGGGFWLLLIGQLAGAVAQPFFTNLPTRLAAEWFPRGERDGATVASSMANPVGNALGSVVPALVVFAAGDISSLLLGQAVMFSAVAALAYLVVPTAPPSPPSASAARRWRERAEDSCGEKDGSGFAAQLLEDCRGGSGSSSEAGAVSDAVDGTGAASPRSAPTGSTRNDRAAAALRAMVRDCRALLTNANFLRLMLGFGTGLGIFNALLTLLAQWVAPCGISNDTAGEAGGALLGAGLVAAGVAGVVLERSRAYVPTLRALIVAAVCATIFALASIGPGRDVMLLAAFACLGATLIPLLPVALENAAECSYPVAEDTSSALLMTVGQLVGIVLIYGLPPLLALSPDCSSVATPAAALLLACMLLAAGAIASFSADYRRQAAEREGEGGGE